MFLLEVINKVESAQSAIYILSSIESSKKWVVTMILWGFHKSNCFFYNVYFSFKIAQWPFYLYGIWSNLRCRWSMGSISPKNKIQSTKICLVCPTRITFVHQIWYLMNSPICQVEHSPFHFIPYSVPHIYRSSTTALRRLYIQSTLSIMYRKNNWSVATSSSP